MGKWEKIQYLWWMLNNIYFVPDEKDSQNVHILFIFHVHKFWRWVAKTKFTANAALKFVLSWYINIFLRGEGGCVVARGWSNNCKIDLILERCDGVASGRLGVRILWQLNCQTLGNRCECHSECGTLKGYKCWVYRSKYAALHR